MNVEFNENSWHSQLYERAYDSWRPDNLCPYFWKILWVLVTLPISCIGMAFGKNADYSEKIGMTFATYFVSVVATLMGCHVNRVFLQWWSDPYWIAYTVLGLAIITLGIALVFGVMFGVAYIVDVVQSKARKGYKPSSLVGAKIHSVWHGLCPKITWKKDK